MKNIQRFNEHQEDVNISDERIINYIISYTKETTKTDVDISLGANNLDNLIKRLKSSLSENEFNSIWKIETGHLSFG